MASATDSTRAPSRRAFFAHAAASGIAAAQPPIFVVAGLADAALLALGPLILDLIAEREPLSTASSAAQDRFFAEQTAEAEAAMEKADDAYQAMDDRVLEASRRLAAMRATTLDGLILKAKMLDAGGDDDALGDSIVEDLLAMG